MTLVSIQGLSQTCVLSLLICNLYSNGFSNAEATGDIARRLDCVFANQNEPCPPGWEKSYIDDPDRCYYVPPHGANLSESRKICFSMGGNADVITPSTASENSIARIEFQTSGNHIWIGLNDIDGDGIWTWAVYPGYRVVEYGHNSWITKYRNATQREGKKCAYYETVNKRWGVSKCDGTSSYICQKVQANGTCDPGWETMTQYFCIKYVHLPVTFQRAIDACAEENAHLLYIPTNQFSVELNDFIEKDDFTWVNVERKSHDNTAHGYIWGSGSKLMPGESNWAVGQPSSDKTKNCVVLNPKHFWQSESCASKYNPVCIQQTHTGPANVSLQLHYHRPDNVFYSGFAARVSCSAINSANMVLRITITEGSTINNVDAGLYNTSVEYVRSEKGFCVKRVMTELSFKSLDIQRGTTLSCFAISISQPQTCHRFNDALRFCDAKEFSVVDGPKGAPNITLDYDGRADVTQVDEGETLIATCNVSTGLNGTLQWVLHLNNVSLVIREGDKRMKTHERLEGHIVSQLHLKLYRKESGTSIACYAYDAAKFNLEKECNVSDHFCSETKPIDVDYDDTSSKQPSSLRRYLFLLGGVVYFVVVGVVVWATCFRASKYGEVIWQRDEDGDDGDDGDNKHTVDASVSTHSRAYETKPSSQGSRKGDEDPRTEVTQYSMSGTDEQSMHTLKSMKSEKTAKSLQASMK